MWATSTRSNGSCVQLTAHASLNHCGDGGSSCSHRSSVWRSETEAFRFNLIRPVPTGAAVRAGSQARRTRAHGRGPDAQRVGDPVATRLTCWYRAGSPPPPAIAEREVSSAPAPRPFAVRNGGIHDVDDLASCVPRSRIHRRDPQQEPRASPFDDHRVTAFGRVKRLGEVQPQLRAREAFHMYMVHWRLSDSF